MSPGPRPVERSARPSIWTARLGLLLVTAGLGLATLYLALPVPPIAVERMTSRTSAAGVVTAAVSLFTVVFELVAARLVVRLRPSVLLIGALVGEMVARAGFATVPSLPAMLLFGCLLGAGFGTVATGSAALIGALAPPGRQGEAIGYHGLAASVPAIVAPPGAVRPGLRGIADHRLVLPGLAAGAAGLAPLALRSPALTVAAALLHGAAFGTVQTGTFVGMLRSTAGADPSLAGGLWNVAVDAGIGLGALTLAPVAAVAGFPRMLWALPAVPAVAFAIRLAAPPMGGAGARPGADG